jgi:hypothetical protein
MRDDSAGADTPTDSAILVLLTIVFAPIFIVHLIAALTAVAESPLSQP